MLTHTHTHTQYLPTNQSDNITSFEHTTPNQYTLDRQTDRQTDTE